ncbi:MAG: WD40 repeat domain-containing protein, partial [Acidimicrobiales bacterium]
AEAHAAAAAAARQVRVNRRLRTQLVAIAVALVIALIGGFVALDQRGQAEQERQVATARELASASVANLLDDPELSILLALEAIDATRAHGDEVRPEAIEALHQAIAASRAVLRVPGVGGALDWSPDGSIFVTEGEEESGILDIRDAETGESVRMFPGNEIDINDVAFSADGTLASAGDDGYVRLFDPDTGEELATFGTGSGSVYSVSFSADGSRVAAHWGDQQTVKVFDVSTGELVRQLEFGGVPALSPDGTRLLATNADGKIGARMFDVESRRELFTLTDRDDAATSDAQFSPDGRWVATAHSNGLVRIWEAATGRLQHTVSGHTSNAQAVDWSPDSTRVATVGEDGTARVVELVDGAARDVLTLSSRDGRHGLYGVAFSPDGGHVMTGDLAITAVTVWDVTRLGGAELASFESVSFARGSGTFTPGGDLLVSAPGGGVTIWDLEEGVPQIELDTRAVFDDDVRRMALSPDGTVLAATSDNVPVELWDAETGEHLRSIEPDGLCCFVADLSWSPDGEHLALAMDLDLAPDDTSSATVVVDREGTEVSRMVEPPNVFLNSAAFSTDGRSIITSQVSGRNDPANSGFAIWDWRTGELDREVRSRPLEIEPDPRHPRVVAVNQIEGSAEVWDLDRDELIASFRSSGSLYTVAFRRDGQQVAFAGADGTVGLGDPDTGEQQLVLRGHEGGVGNISFSPDGTRLASVGTDGVLRVWALELDALIEIARDRVTRSLDDDECRQWLHVETCPER